MSFLLERALGAAAEAGLNLQAVLGRGRVPALDAPAGPSALLLLGSTGPALWDAMDPTQRDPVDTHCAAAVRALAARLPHPVEVLFPSGESGGPPLDILAVGRAAGWAHPSPLGLGVHPEHGPWVAYRGLLRIRAELPERGLSDAPSPCAGCPRPCVDACVGDAFPDGILALHRCFASRLAGPPCLTICAARRACPVGRASQYGAAQEAWHQGSGNRLYRAHSTPEDP